MSTSTIVYAVFPNLELEQAMGKASRKKKAGSGGLRVPITPELQAHLVNLRRAFVEKFGREPRPEDPLFFDMDADTPQRMNEHELTARMSGFMRTAGTDPAIIHAWEKTGLMATEQNWHLLSEDDKAEWMDAIEEYESLHPQTPPH